MYASYIYIKGESIVAPVILHMMCNTLQFPRFDYLNSQKISKEEKNVINFLYIFGISGFFTFIIFY